MRLLPIALLLGACSATPPPAVVPQQPAPIVLLPPPAHHYHANRHVPDHKISKALRTLDSALKAKKRTIEESPDKIDHDHGT